jgi:spermidine synthase
MARLYSDAYGPIPIDGAELDAKIIEAGRTYFDMNEPNLHAVAQDARRFLRHSGGGYDVIAIDAYRPPYIPFHLTTVEFFALAKERLNPDGVVVVNVGRTASDFSLVDAIAATLQQVFPAVYVVDEPSGDSPLGNTMVVATKRPSTLADFRANLPRYDHPLLAEVARRAAPQAHRAAPPTGTPIFTDDRAPVELVVHGLVLRQFLGGR